MWCMSCSKENPGYDQGGYRCQLFFMFCYLTRTIFRCYLVGRSLTFMFWWKVDLYPSDSECGLLSHMWAIITYSPHTLWDGCRSRYRLDTLPSANTRRSGYAASQTSCLLMRIFTRQLSKLVGKCPMSGHYPNCYSGTLSS